MREQLELGGSPTTFGLAPLRGTAILPSTLGTLGIVTYD